MSAHWEYLSVAWQQTTNFATKAPDEQQTWESTYRITRPNAELETLPAADVSWSKLLNDLGAEGWEMVTESIRSTVIFGHSLGWTNVGSPVQIVWQFKRLGA